MTTIFTAVTKEVLLGNMQRTKGCCITSRLFLGKKVFLTSYRRLDNALHGACQCKWPRTSAEVGLFNACFFNAR